MPHIRPEERLMAAQQHQLLQAANAQHMAAMVALEAMQNQAKVICFFFRKLRLISFFIEKCSPTSSKSACPLEEQWYPIPRKT